MKQLNKHIAVLVGLVLVSLGLFFLGNQKGSQASFDTVLFQVKDTAGLKHIHVERKGSVLDIAKGESWALDNGDKVDLSLIRVTKAIMSQVQVVRPVSKLSFDEIKNDLKTKGSKVTITTDEGDLAFIAGGNANKSVCYFADSDLSEIYVVAIPGYQNYLSGIFELTRNQWRDRLLFDSNWRSIQNLNIDYATGDQLEIYFDKKMLAVRGVSHLDTAAFMSYLGQYQQFLLNDYLDEGQYPRYDSLASQEPLATLTIKDLDVDLSRTLRVYPLISNEKFYLLKDEKEQMIVLDKQRVEQLLQKPKYFAVK